MKRFFQAWGILVATLAVTGQPGELRLPPIAQDVPFSFVVLGDNRGDESGQQPPAFTEVLTAVQREAPCLILDSGDMIYGHTRDAEELETQWRIYRQTVSDVRAPIFHVPGNHDLWSAKSAKVYRRLWGRAHYAFTYGNSLFIGLDTETASERVDERQFKWLEAALRTCRLDKRVCVHAQATLSRRWWNRFVPRCISRTTKSVAPSVCATCASHSWGLQRA